MEKKANLALCTVKELVQGITDYIYEHGFKHFPSCDFVTEKTAKEFFENPTMGFIPQLADYEKILHVIDFGWHGIKAMQTGFEGFGEMLLIGRFYDCGYINTVTIQAMTEKEIIFNKIFKLIRKIYRGKIVDDTMMLVQLNYNLK